MSDLLELPLIHDPRESLETHFGFRDFLSGQEPIVSAILSGRDTLAIMPTGGGKSLCFQLPAMVMDGVTIVVSPLIALMKDQVDALTAKGIPATVINSTLSPAEQSERLDQLREGKFKLVYVAPERFRSGAFLSTLSKVEIALFAVDEAHCLSQWGHDFRPDYLKLSEAVEKLGYPQTAAFTATATPIVREDILKTLKLRDPFVAVSGFERPNLSLAVRPCDSHRDKYDRIEKIVEEQKTGIVYCATRKKVEEVTETLGMMGIKVVAYHGGMDDKERTEAQNRFLDRSIDVAVATNAFGMGIDRSDVRFVIHFDVPGSIEAYYQEAGRAGRDGEPAVCELLFNYADTRTQEFFIEGNNPGYGIICDVYRALKHVAKENGEAVVPIRELSDIIGAKNGMAVSSAISHLVRAGHLQRFDVQGERTRGTRLTNPETEPEDLEIDTDALAEKEKRDREKLDSVVAFCYDDDCCRQAWILNYFGEAGDANCGTCDVCGSDEISDKRAPDDEEMLIVQKALSGVARASRQLPNGEWEPIFGKGKIVSMLCGSKSQEVLKVRLDQLSTHGILKEEGSAYVYALFGELEKAGLVVTKKTPYPLVTLSPRGATVMRGDRNFRIAWPDRSKLAASPSAKKKIDASDLSELDFDEVLYDKLKRLRNDVASEAGMPPYVVFSNKTLEIFCRLKPTTAD
ncbi:MAG: RecQ family ATP-dependent DNA helicase, partial [Verrucomicrobiales bacterium]|nr:RecQ family ATP-dependent DNA helicase [Verrucomicrobiales bacterium]